MCEVVELNVGGRLFQAYRNTLERSVHLKTLLGNDLEDDALDPDGRLFIDRDPELFAQVLKLLRGYRYRICSGLSWEEIKGEADFYQVPELECLAPEKPVTVVVPEETVSIRRVSLKSFVTKRGRQHFEIDDSNVRELPPELASQVYELAPYRGSPQALSVDSVIAAGFEPKDPEHSNGADKDKWVYECKERVVFYAKTAGAVLQVPELHNEVLREDCIHWIRITCRSKVTE